MRDPIYKVEKYKDIKEMMKKSGEKYADRPAYLFKTEEEGKFREISHKQFRDEVNYLGTKLIDMGLKDKRIAVIGENCYEWGVSYLAVVTGTGIVVPLDKSLPENEIRSLIKRSEVEAIFYTSKYDEIMNKIKQEGISKIKFFISMSTEENKDDIYSIKVLKEEGKKLLENGDNRFVEAKIDPNVMGIMLFTSGTTATSKAVMLSHKNIVSNLYDIASVIKLVPEDRMLSFLPLHHTFESTVGFLYPISCGCAICFCEGIKHIGPNIKEYDITAMISVPALFEGMFKQVKRTIQKQGKWEKVQKGLKISRFLLKLGIDLRQKIFKEIHQALGPNLRLLVAGGAAMDPETERYFNDLGFNLYQGYGLTETSPVVAAEDDKYRKVGSIGKAFPSLDVKIEEPDEQGIGELMVKGPTVMLGYYENEEATKEVIEKDGYFHTGDLAKIDKEGYIFITGRKKFVIVLKNGKNIFPEELEALVNKIEGVKESFVYGKPEPDGDYKICAKIVYDKDAIKEKYNIEENKEITEEEIKEKLWNEVKKVNKQMPAYKYIREITVTEKELIKTTTQKVKRFEEIKTVI